MQIGNIEVTDLRQHLPHNYDWRDLQDIDLLVVHHSGVDVDSTAEQINAYHRYTMGWPGIGYHFLVHWDGRTEYVGDIITVRYHAGPRNKGAIGICLTGDFNQRPPGEEQLNATRDLLANLQLAHGWAMPIVGHHEIILPGRTACPGDTFINKPPYWSEKIRVEGEGGCPLGAVEGVGASLNPQPSTLHPIHGIHWRNDSGRIEESDLHKFALGKFDWVATICYPNPSNGRTDYLGVYRRLREINPRVKFVVRLNLSGQIKSSEFVAAFAPRLEELREFTDLFQIHNEPNHPGEHFGGSSDDSAWRYRWWHRRVVEGLKEIAPWAKLGFPGLAVMQREEAWLDICAPAIKVSDWLGCHVYWQHDNWASPDWGGRYALFAKAFPDKDLYITEYGDSTPSRSDVEKARVYRQWLDKIQGQGSGREPSGRGQGVRVKAACAFILSSADPAWEQFTLDEEACEILGRVKGQGAGANSLTPDP